MRPPSKGCPMNPPVLREAIRLPNLRRVPVPVRTVVTLPERRVHRPAHLRIGPRRLHRRGGPEDHPAHHIHHSARLPRRVHRGIMQLRRCHLERLPRPPRLAGPRRYHLRAERLQDRPRTRPSSRSLTSVTNSWTASAVRSPGTTDTTRRCSGSNATWSQQSPRNWSSGSSSSQFVSFWATNDHFSSIGSSRVSGAVGHPLVVRGAGMITGGAAGAADGIGMDLDEARRLEDATPLVDVFEDRGDLVLGPVGALQRGTLAFGEPVATGAAREQAKLPELAESAGDGEVSGVASSEVGTSGIQATESREVVHGLRCGLEREARTRLEPLL